MRFISVEGAGFKSIDAPLTFCLDRKPGLYHITGRNELNQRLGANGVGKSTILDLVFWVFYGYTSRKLKAGNVHTWGSKQKTYGVVVLELEGIRYHIKRTWKPNGLFLKHGKTDWKEIDDQALLKLVGINPTAFLNSIYISQFSTMFFDMNHQDQAALFSNVLQLDEWIERSKLASRRATELSRELQALEVEYSKVEGILQTKEDQIQQAIESRDSAESKLRGEIKAIKQELNELCNDLRPRLENEMDKIAKEICLCEDFLGTNTDLRKQILAKYYAIKKELERGTETYNRLIAQEDAIAEADSLEQNRGTCTHCGQELDNHSKKAAHRKHLSELSKIKSQLDDLEPQLNQMETDLDRMEPDLDKLDAEIADLNGDVHKLKRAHQGLSIELKETDLEIRSLERELKDKQDNSDVLDTYISKNELDLIPVKAQLIELQDAIVETSRVLERVKYWIKGFKEVRLFIIDQALTDLEIEVNSVLDSLGLDGWEVKFETERETTAKTVKRAFEVMIYSPENEKSVPWEAWSGGEATRLRVAGTAGLSNLVLSACGIESNIEIWDEPSSHLSGEGIDDLVQLLHRRALETGKQVYLIDHHAFSSGVDFQGVITVVKDKQGTYLEEA